jgi:chromosomal replication initiator protein
MTGFLSMPRPRAKSEVEDIVSNMRLISDPELTQIRDFVAEYYGMSGRALTSKRRKREIAWARHVAIYLSCTCTKEKLIDIGKCYNRTHPTALHSYYVVVEAMDRDARIRGEVEELTRGIKDVSK